MAGSSIRSAGAPTPTQAHILAVEDDQGNREVLSSLLISAGYLVYTAASGQAALAHLAAQRLDVVILDFLLPDMTGLALMAQLRANGCMAPMLLLSGNISPEARHATQQADAYLMKPYDTDALLNAVSNLLAPAASADA